MLTIQIWNGSCWPAPPHIPQAAVHDGLHASGASSSLQCVGDPGPKVQETLLQASVAMWPHAHQRSCADDGTGMNPSTRTPQVSASVSKTAALFPWGRPCALLHGLDCLIMFFFPHFAEHSSPCPGSHVCKSLPITRTGFQSSPYSKAAF